MNIEQIKRERARGSGSFVRQPRSRGHAKCTVLSQLKQVLTAEPRLVEVAADGQAGWNR